MSHELHHRTPYRFMSFMILQVPIQTILYPQRRGMQALLQCSDVHQEAVGMERSVAAQEPGLNISIA